MGKILTKSDDATMFVLAGCMIDVCINMAIKGYPQEAKERTAKVINNAVKVLNKDPTFMKRFQKAQEAVMDEFNRGLS